MSRNSQISNTPKNAGFVPDLSPLEHLMDQDVTPRQVCGVLAKMFQVQQTEVALLRLDRGLLQFVYPDELRTAGSIPISSSSIAAHTAISKKSEIFNNFARVKHASIFETVKLGASEGVDTSEPLPIQKLMSAPVVVAKGRNYLALRIRQIALDHEIPIVENQPLAQALYKSADVGQEIPPHLYRAVAEVLAYIYKLMHPGKK